ncbi:MAG: hypothetical protein J6T98_09755 [Salinivirgaceae bacterium]|nr:hypothetical protein [Salinivirgaceae bacterium]
MKRCIIIVSMLLLPIISLAQNYNIQARRGSFQPMSFDEYVAPLMMYKQHAEASENKFWEYINMGNDAYNNRSYSTAKMYYTRASDLNQKFKFVNQSDLNENISLCDWRIEAQKNASVFREYMNSCIEAYNNEKYSDALYYCKKASSLNQKYDYIDQSVIDDNLNTINKCIATQSH